MSSLLLLVVLLALTRAAMPAHALASDPWSTATPSALSTSTGTNVLDSVNGGVYAGTSRATGGKLFTASIPAAASVFGSWTDVTPSQVVTSEPAIVALGHSASCLYAGTSAGSPGTQSASLYGTAFPVGTASWSKLNLGANGSWPNVGVSAIGREVVDLGGQVFVSTTTPGGGAAIYSAPDSTCSAVSFTERLNFGSSNNPTTVPVTGVTAVTAMEASGGALWVGTNGTGTAHLLVSTNFGATWVDKTTSLPTNANDVEVASITHLGGTIFVAIRNTTGVRLLASTDAGTTWTQVGANGLGGSSGYPSARLTTAWGRVWIALGGSTVTTPSQVLTVKDNAAPTVVSDSAGFTGNSGCPCAALEPAIIPLGTPIGRLLWGGRDTAGTAGAQLVNLIDAAPPAGVNASIAPVGITNAGAVTVSFTLGSDDVSGIGSWQLERASSPLAGAACGGAWTGFSQVGPPSPVVPTFTDTTTASGLCYRYQLVVSDLAGHSSSSVPSSPVLVDRTAPTATIASSDPGPNVGAMVTFSGTSADPESGVGHVDVLYSGPEAGSVCLNPGTPTSWSCNWNPTGHADGTYTITATTYDVAGNLTTKTVSLQVDATAPTGASVSVSTTPVNGDPVVTFAKGTDPVPGTGIAHWTLQRATGTLASGACGAQGAYSTVATDPAGTTYGDSGVLSGTCATYRLLVTDVAGNTSTNTVPGGTVPVDRTPPTGSIGSLPVGPVGGSGTLSLSGNDGDALTAVSSVVVTSDIPGNANLCTATAPSASWTCSWNYSGVPTGNWNVTATIHDAAGNVATAGGVLHVDGTAPTGGSITVPSAPTSGATTIAFTTGTDAGGAGAGSTSLERSVGTLSGGTCSAFGSYVLVATNPTSPYLDSVPGAAACARYRLLVTDGVGNVGTFTGPGGTARIDRTPPTADTLSAPTGSSNATSIPVAFSGGSDGESGVATHVLERRVASLSAATCDFGVSAFAPVVSAVTSSPAIDSTPPATGCVQYRMQVADLAGNVATSAVAPANPLQLDAAPPVLGDITLSSTSSRFAVDPIAHRAWFAADAPRPLRLTVTGTASDAGSGLQPLNVPGLAAQGWSRTNATVTPASGPGTFSFDYEGANGAADPPLAALVAVDLAGNASAPASFDVDLDAAPPAGTTLTATAGAPGSGTVTVALAPGTDAASGLAGWTLERRPGTAGTAGASADACTDGSAAWTALSTGAAATTIVDHPPSTGCWQYHLVARDNVGNVTTAVAPRVILKGFLDATTGPTQGQDHIVGTSGNDVIDGLAGNDHVDGGAGNDQISGGAGNDVLLGATGNDLLDGGVGNDTLDGGSGDDVLIGGPGLDTLDGGVGDDRVTGGPGADTLRGGVGDDRITGQSGSDLIDGGAGNDTIDARDATKVNARARLRDGGWLGRILARTKAAPPDVVKCGKGTNDRVKADGNDIVAKDCEHVTRPRIKLIR